MNRHGGAIVHVVSVTSRLVTQGDVDEIIC